MSRYLVTGASGFVGHWLSDYLQSQGHEVVPLLRRPAAGPWNHAFCCELIRFFEFAYSLLGLMFGAPILAVDLRPNFPPVLWRKIAQAACAV